MFVFINLLKYLIEGFTFQDDVGVVFMGTDSRHGFEEDSYVTFQDVKGMTEVNGQEYKIKVTSKIFI